VLGGVSGALGVAPEPLPLVVDEEPVPVLGAGGGATLEPLLAAGAFGGGLEELELEPLSQPTSASVASVAPTAMIVFFMVRLSNSDAQERFSRPFAPWRSPQKNVPAAWISPCEYKTDKLVLPMIALVYCHAGHSAEKAVFRPLRRRATMKRAAAMQWAGTMITFLALVRRGAATVLFFLAMGSAAEAACAAVASRSEIMAASWRAIAATTDGVGITFLGHASFLIESPGGVSIVTDYSDFNRPPFTPDVVTMNHAHSTHYTDFPDPAIKLVLRGWVPGGGIAHHDLQYSDVRIHNVPTNIRDFGRTEFAGNSIFVFDVADLCIAHLSHLHHTLTERHLAELGPVDILMAPVDGTWTLGQDEMIEVIEQIRPAVVIPMHYFTTRVLDTFLTRLDDRYPIRRSETARIAVSRTTLPRQTEILVLPGH
jgi:L-ascorbate metabolism protein UlaG (beta-lactamase superfamily)